MDLSELLNTMDRDASINRKQHITQLFNLATFGFYICINQILIKVSFSIYNGCRLYHAFQYLSNYIDLFG